MKDTIKEYAQKKVSEFLAKYAPFITSKYRDNKQAVNEIGFVLVLLFVVLWAFLIAYDTIGLKEIIELYIKMVGGTAILGAAYFGWKRLEVNQEGQITERFTRAIDQLGATHSDGEKSLEVRLGGIYALERIAKDSEKDYWPIMEVLTAYVRTNSKANLPDTPEEKHLFDSREDYPQPREAPIEAIVSVINRRFHLKEHEELNFKESNMCLSQFNSAMLTGAIFWYSDLRYMKFEDCHLEGTNFTGSYLHGTSFSYSNMESAKLYNIEGDNVNFYSAIMLRVDLDGAKLRNSRFVETSLLGALLLHTRLRECNFTDADLTEANFTFSDLRGSNFTRTSLSGTKLSDVNLSKVIGLSKEQIESAIIDRKTILPDYLMDNPEWYEEQIKRSEEWIAEEDQES